MKQSGLSPKFKVTGMGTDSVLVYKKVVTGVCQTITVQILLLNFIYNAPVPVLKKKEERTPSTVQLHISDSIHREVIHALKNSI